MAQHYGRAVAMLFGALAVAAVVVAPVASAEPAGSAEPECSDTGGATVCQTPGNAEINATPPVDEALPYPWWEDSWNGPLFVGG